MSSAPKPETQTTTSTTHRLILTRGDPGGTLTHAMRFPTTRADLGGTLTRSAVSSVPGIGYSKVRKQLRHMGEEEQAREVRRRTPFVMEDAAGAVFVGKLDPGKGEEYVVMTQKRVKNDSAPGGYKTDVYLTLVDDFYDFHADKTASAEALIEGGKASSRGSSSSQRPRPEPGKKRMRLPAAEKARLEAERAARKAEEDKALEDAEERMKKVEAMRRRFGANAAGHAEVDRSRYRGHGSGGGGGGGRRGWGGSDEDSGGFSDMDEFEGDLFQDDEGDLNKSDEERFDLEHMSSDDESEEDSEEQRKRKRRLVELGGAAEERDEDSDNDDVFANALDDGLETDDSDVEKDDDDDDDIEEDDKAAVAAKIAAAEKESVKMEVDVQMPSFGGSGVKTEVKREAGSKRALPGGTDPLARNVRARTAPSGQITAQDIADAVNGGCDSSRDLVRKFKEQGRLDARSQDNFIALVKRVCKVTKTTKKLVVKPEARWKK